MNEENKNQITYDEDWQSVSVAEYPKAVEYNADEVIKDNSEKENNKIPKKKKDFPRQLLITIQLIVCIIIALAAFVLKNIGGDIYDAARQWYYGALNNSVIFEDSTGFDLGAIFGTASADEA